MIVDELIYFLKYKKYIIMITLSIILSCICIIGYKFIQYSSSYKYYKDLHYVIEGSYCEDIQDLQHIDIYNSHGKVMNTTLYVETTDFQFDANSSIVRESDIDEFKAKYNNVKKVKVRYLPNSNKLLYIEPVE